MQKEAIPQNIYGITSFLNYLYFMQVRKNAAFFD